MRIPLPSMLRAWRERDFARGNPTLREKLALKLWAYAAKRPRLYHAVSGAMVKLLALLAGRSGRLSWLPFAGAWTRNRDIARPGRQDLPSALREEDSRVSGSSANRKKVLESIRRCARRERSRYVARGERASIDW